MEQNYWNRKIIHLDMDAFYASVEIRDNPALAGRPVAVGGSDPKQRGVLCTSNYIARKFGVRSAMSTQMALNLCPDLVIIHPNFSKYKEASDIVKEIFKRFTDKIEPLSLDEAYLDVTDTMFLDNCAYSMAIELKKIIKFETGLTASCGVAPNKFLAKIASDWNKPDGIFEIKPHQVTQFVKDLPVRKICGVGKVTSNRLRAIGIETCQDVLDIGQQLLNEKFKSFGPELYKFAQGIDMREVKSTRKVKSFSAETTFIENIGQDSMLLLEVEKVFFELNKRMKKRNHQLSDFKSIFLKIKNKDFESYTREKPFTDFSLAEFSVLLNKFLKERPINEEYRLIGLGLKFKEEKESGPQLDFLDLAKSM